MKKPQQGSFFSSFHISICSSTLRVRVVEASGRHVLEGHSPFDRRIWTSSFRNPSTIGRVTTPEGRVRWRPNTPERTVEHRDFRLHIKGKPNRVHGFYLLWYRPIKNLSILSTLLSNFRRVFFQIGGNTAHRFAIVFSHFLEMFSRFVLPLSAHVVGFSRHDFIPSPRSEEWLNFNKDMNLKRNI